MSTISRKSLSDSRRRPSGAAQASAVGFADLVRFFAGARIVGEVVDAPI